MLDNLEHLLAAAAAEVGALLVACPHLAILATSRAPLHLAGEQEWAVAPLATPALDRVPTAAEVAAAPAAQLFLARARAVLPAFALTDANAAAVAAICRRLDGLPLALELAAAWVKLLPPTALLARLDPALPLLEGGARDLPAGQRTMRATIAWSHDLLAERERTLLRRLAVFAGGGTLAAIEAVCADAGLPVATVLAAAATLLDQSLLRREPATDPTTSGNVPQAEDEEAGPRVALLETIREYAAERLAASGEGEALRARHARHFLALAESPPAARDAAWGGWLARLERERDNLRAALAWALAAGEAETALRLGSALRAFWRASGTASEGRRWLAQALAGTGTAPAPLRARALRAAAHLAHYQGDYARARALYETQLALCREADDARGVAAALGSLGGVALNQGEYARAQALLEEGLSLRRAAGDRSGSVTTLGNLGGLAQRRGDLGRAQALLEETLALAHDLGDAWGAAMTCDALGWLALFRGDLRRAEALLTAAMVQQGALGSLGGGASTATRLGWVVLARGDSARARTLLLEGLARNRDRGLRWGVAYALEGLAGVAGAQGRATGAARLGGAAAALREAIGAPLPPIERRHHERALAAARAQLGEAAWRAAWDAGRALPFERVLAVARESTAAEA